MGKLAINGGTPVNPTPHERWPIITEADKKAVKEVCESKILWSSDAPQITSLEKEWAEYLGAKHVLAANSGNAGLHMAVAALGIGPGDEVITPSLTFVSTQMCVLENNAIPVFADVDPRTFNIDPKKVEEKITPKTKAIIPVDLHGQPADYDELRAIADKHGLKIIGDCAQSHGAMYKGQKAGLQADISMFSLNGLKNLQSGDGGLVNTDDDELRARADQCRLFGEYVEPGKPRNYNSLTVGWLYRMMEWPAAFARSRLRSLDAENAVRQENAAHLTKLLSDIPGVVPPYVKPDRTSVYHHYRIRLDINALGITNMDSRHFRARVQKALRAEGVEANRWQNRPVQLQGVFQNKEGYGKGCPWSCPHARQFEYDPADFAVAQEILNDSFVFVDPVYPPNGKDVMERYAAGVHKVFENLDEVLAIELPEDDFWLRD